MYELMLNKKHWQIAGHRSHGRPAVSLPVKGKKSVASCGGK